MSVANPAEATPGPIADLSYRGYDGPLRLHPLRWLVIAKMTAALSIKKKAFWVLAFLALVPWLLTGFLLYLRSQAPSGLAEALQEPLGQSFYQAHIWSLFWIFLTTLLTGASSIAGDNRTNALQIYLSKPVSKWDYLAGKWMGLYAVLTTLMLVPTLILLLFCAATYWNQGFMRDYPYLWLQAIGSAFLPGALYASLMLGVSSCFKRPVLAGGIFAGAYFGLGIVTRLIALILWQSNRHDDSVTVRYLSVGGMLDGLAQHIFGTQPAPPGMRRFMPQEMQNLPRPELLWLMIAAVVLVIGGIAIARLKIRAVEVVKG
jgi:ABC-2 type transport system permease protein